MERGSLLGQVSRRHVLRGIGGDEPEASRAEAFWDGRAADTCLDPWAGAVSIATGVSLESQALGPILSDVEMAKEGRTWDDAIARLEFAPPLGLASDWPTDVSAAIALDETYPELFETAFGDTAIAPVRSALRAGEFDSLQEVIGFYQPGDQDPENLDPLMPVPVPAFLQGALGAFLDGGLTDPRVELERGAFARLAPVPEPGLTLDLAVGVSGLAAIARRRWPSRDHSLGL